MAQGNVFEEAVVVTGLQEFDYDISGGFAALDHHGFPLSMMIQGQKTAE